MKPIRYVFVILILSATFWSGCGPNDTRTESSQAPDLEQEVPGESLANATDNALESSTFTGTGLVMNITPSKTFIVIEHQEISGFMGAMTMPFAIKDEGILESVAVGDSIDFEVTISGSETYVSSISATGQ